MIQDAAAAAAKQDPTAMLVIAGLASALTIVARGLLNIVLVKVKGDRRRPTFNPGGSNQHLAEEVAALTAQFSDLASSFKARSDDIMRVEKDLALMHERYHTLSNQMSGMLAQMRLILDGRIK